MELHRPFDLAAKAFEVLVDGAQIKSWRVPKHPHPRVLLVQLWRDHVQFDERSARERVVDGLHEERRVDLDEEPGLVGHVGEHVRLWSRDHAALVRLLIDVVHGDDGGQVDLGDVVDLDVEGLEVDRVGDLDLHERRGLRRQTRHESMNANGRHTPW